MNGPLIPGGYILLSRKLIESEIMKKPPLYLKVWIWLLLKASHGPYKNLDRGEYITSIPEIQEAMSWMVGYRKVRPSYKQIRDILDWLRNPCEGNTMGNTNGNMIDTTKVTHGIKLKIANYDFYQNPQNYEGHNEGQNERNVEETRKEKQGQNRNKNNDNKDNENIYSLLFEHWNSKKIIVHQKLTDEFKKDIDKALKQSSLEEIIKAIDHYAEAYHDPKYEYCKYKWGIHEFLTRKEGYKRFLDDGSKWLNYLRHKNNQQTDKPKSRYREE